MSNYTIDKFEDWLDDCPESARIMFEQIKKDFEDEIEKLWKVVKRNESGRTPQDELEILRLGVLRIAQQLRA